MTFMITPVVVSASMAAISDGLLHFNIVQLHLLLWMSESAPSLQHLLLLSFSATSDAFSILAGLAGLAVRGSFFLIIQYCFLNR